jgi:hypothetical protein
MTEHSAAKNFSVVPPAPGAATIAHEAAHEVGHQRRRDAVVDF